MVSYDTVQMAVKKVEYIRDHRLGGTMWWESSADKPGSESIIGNVSDALSHRHSGSTTSSTDRLSSLSKVAKHMCGYDGGKTEFVENNLHFPDSKYENLRKGMPGE